MERLLRGLVEELVRFFEDITNLDLTPSYLYNEDAIHFHKTLKETCDRHDKRYYPDFKKWCDKYFYIEHRKESRGIGGIFFDDLDDKDQNELFLFIKDACSSFIPCYMPIIEKRKVINLRSRANCRACHSLQNRSDGNKSVVDATSNSISSLTAALNSVSARPGPGSNLS